MGVACILSGPSTGFVVSVDRPSFCPLSALSPAACRLRVADHCHLLRTPISAVSVAFFMFLLSLGFIIIVPVSVLHFLSSAAMAVSSCTTMTGVSSSVAALASSNSVLLHGASVVTPTRVVLVCGRATVRSISCRAKVEAEDAVVSTEVAPALPRRLALALLAGAVVAGSRAAPANAAYGETANIFGKAKVDPGFVTKSYKGFKLDVPSKWVPSPEREFPGTILKYEDNFDSVTNFVVSVVPSSKGSIKDYGPPEKFLEEVSYLLGKQSYSGLTQSEGGFKDNAVSTANLLESSATDVNGKPYYKLSLLTRTADNTEGGRHQIIVGTVADGKLYLLKAQAGDKRWFKGTKKFVEGVANSFSVIG